MMKSDSNSFVTDTHALIWHLTSSPQLSTEAKRRFHAADQGEAVIYISIMSMIEVIYLSEKKKIPPPLLHLLFQLLLSEDKRTYSYRVVDISAEIVLKMPEVPREKIPELPDRIIATTAYALKYPLITKDHRMHEWEGVVTIW